MHLYIIVCLYCPDTKRLIGRKFEDSTIQRGVKRWPFKVTNRASELKIEVECDGEPKTFNAEEVRRSSTLRVWLHSAPVSVWQS